MADELDVAGLRERVRGPVLTPDDPQMEELCQVWNDMYSHRRPAVMVRATGTRDVQEAIAFARENGLRFAIRSGGHSYAGASTIDGGLLLDLRLLAGVRIDAEQRTADVQGGVTLGAFDREAQAFGLATTAGVVSTTAVAGLTLGGGVGRMMRKHGLSCDNVLAFDVVTADGQALTADADHHPDLFWALRGGGSNFGVVTSIRFALHPVGPTVVGGYLGWPQEQMRDVLAASAELLADAPEELSMSLLLTTAPTEEYVPEALRGKPLCLAVVSWLGPVEEAERVFAPLRAVTPAIDLVGPASYTELQSSVDALNPYGIRAYLKTGYLADLSDDVLDVAERLAARFVNPTDIVELALMGGAVARADPSATAFGQRDAGFFYIAAALWDDPSGDAASIEWCGLAEREFNAVKIPGAYLNFMSDVDEDSVRDAQLTDTYARLAAVKERYDPEDFFVINPNRDPVLSSV